MLACLRYEVEKLHSAADAAAIEEIHATYAQKKPSSTKVCTNLKCLRAGHSIEKCWHPGGGDKGNGPRARSQKKKEVSETASVAVVEEKMEETHISALLDELPTTAPCLFHDNPTTSMTDTGRT